MTADSAAAFLDLIMTPELKQSDGCGYKLLGEHEFPISDHMT